MSSRSVSSLVPASLPRSACHLAPFSSTPDIGNRTYGLLSPSDNFVLALANSVFESARLPACTCSTPCCQLTFLPDTTLPATVMYDRDWLLAKRDAFSEPAASVCHTLRQLGIHSGLFCLSKRKKKHPYRAGRRKQQGRPVSVLLSSRN